MNEFQKENFPAWPTAPWILGEIRIYLLAILISGGGFLAAVGLIYSGGGAIFVVGLLLGALSMVALTPNRGRRGFQWAKYLASKNLPTATDGASESSTGQKREYSNELDEIPDELQKLLDSATRMAAENEALRSDIAQLRQRALRRQAGRAP